MSNWLDRTIGFFNPAAGARRAAWRQRMQLVDELRGYQAAKGGRLNAYTAFGGPPNSDSDIIRDGPRLRARSYDLVINNGIATKIVSEHVDHIIGSGIIPRFETGDEKNNKLLTELFDAFSKNCHPERTMNFYGVQRALVGGMVTGGFMMVRQRIRRKTDGLKVPLQLQIMTPEFLDATRSEPAGGHLNSIIGGIEFDAIGARRGYWLHRRHPSSPHNFKDLDNQSSFVPASEIAFLYEAVNGMSLGAPWLAPVISDLQDAGDYQVAEGIRKKIEACHVGVIIPGEGDDDIPSIGLVDDANDDGAPGIVDVSGNPVNRFEPGMFSILRGGKDIKFNTPSVSAGIEQYLRTKYRLIAAGARLPYELMTGDYGDSNFASGKLALLAYKRFVDAMQWNYVIPQVCDPVVSWFLNACKLAGLIPQDLEPRVEYDPPPFESITRLDDARADLIEVRMGKRSLREVIATTGRDPQTVIKEIAEMNAQLDAHGVVLDSDPRNVSINGQLQLGQTADNQTGQSNGSKP